MGPPEGSWIRVSFPDRNTVISMRTDTSSTVVPEVIKEMSVVLGVLVVDVGKGLTRVLSWRVV